MLDKISTILKRHACVSTSKSREMKLELMILSLKLLYMFPRRDQGVDIKSKSLILSFKDNKLIKLNFINSDFICYITCALECFLLS